MITDADDDEIRCQKFLLFPEIVVIVYESNFGSMTIVTILAEGTSPNPMLVLLCRLPCWEPLVCPKKLPRKSPRKDCELGWRNPLKTRLRTKGSFSLINDHLTKGNTDESSFASNSSEFNRERINHGQTLRRGCYKK
jgi:hypothetical protein